MFRKVILCALASAAMIPAMAIAHPGGGGGGGGGMGGPPGGMGGMGGMGNAGGMGGMGGISDMGSTMRDQGRLNSQGPEHASQTGIDHANSNSVLSGSSNNTLNSMFPDTKATKSVTSGTLAGLTTGMTLMSNGTAVGTVQQIRTTGNGSVAVIIVQGTNGGFYAVPASKLTLSGGTLSTTARLAGVNNSTGTTMSSQARLNSQGPAHASATGIARANSHSVLAGANNSPGTTISSQARLNSQGPVHASATGIAHANSHSVLAGAGTTTPLTGVSVGMPLFSNGTQVGTVVRVVTANGIVTRVLVQGTNGRTYSLAPSTLTASGGSLMTSATLRGF